jgi:MFS family permease
MPIGGVKDEKYLNLWKSLYVCLCFFLLFIAFNSTQNLSSEVQKLNNLGNFGYILLAILYLFIGIGSLVSSAVLKKIGFSKCLVIGASGHFCFVFAQILPAWRYDYPVTDDSSNFEQFLQKEAFVKFVLTLSVILNGLGAAVIWVAQGEYFSKCATEQSKGFYFGIFWSWYQGS